ncbi:MAG: hypothetical protein JNK72_24650 [Myxococcales bacterium]|nr:hypothetical protein [Myxococcales bacterium]
MKTKTLFRKLLRGQVTGNRALLSVRMPKAAWDAFSVPAFATEVWAAQWPDYRRGEARFAFKVFERQVASIWAAARALRSLVTRLAQKGVTTLVLKPTRFPGMYREWLTPDVLRARPLKRHGGRKTRKHLR